MPPKIHFGVNLNFAKFVYGPKRAIDIVSDVFGLNCVEAVPDIDFGPTLYLTDREAFRAHHREIYEHAQSRGVNIASVLTFYRDTGSIAHSEPHIRESAYRVGLSILEMASCYHARYASAALFTMNKELAEDPEQFQAHFDMALDVWKRWLDDAHMLDIPGMLIEMAAAYREGFSTIEDSKRTLEILDSYQFENEDSTAPLGICYDTGHGISEEESSNPDDRDFEAWFDAFPHRILEIHLKDTDPEFQETFHFGSDRGIINLNKLIRSIRDRLTVPEVLLMLEVPGKRGREIGEKLALTRHQASIGLVKEALEANGYTRDDSGAWINASQ